MSLFQCGQLLFIVDHQPQVLSAGQRQFLRAKAAFQHQQGFTQPRLAQGNGFFDTGYPQGRRQGFQCLPHQFGAVAIGIGLDDGQSTAGAAETAG